MMHKKLVALASAGVLFAALAVTPVTASAQDVNYNLPTAEEIQKRKDSRRNEAISERIGRRVMAAVELYEAGDANGAIAELKDLSIRSDLDQAFVNRLLGSLYAGNDQLDEALPLVKAAADADILGWNDQATALKLTADLSLQLEQYNQAIQYYGKWLQFSGEADPDVFLRIANAYYEMKQFDKIIQPADLAIRNYEEPNKNPYVLKVASYYERKMYSDAVKVLEAGLKVIPDEKNWWNQLGMMYLLEEKIDKALQTLEVAYLAGYFDKESQYKALIQLYGNNEIPYKAARLMEKHLNNGDLEPTARLWQNAAQNYDQAREYKRAAALYGKAAELEETNADKATQYRRQGTSYLRAEMYTQAAAAYSKALDLGIEERGAVYMSLTEAYFYQNKFSQALASVKEAQKFENERRSARSWEQYIRSKASNRGVKL